MVEKKMGVVMGLLFALLFALLVALYDLVFTKAAGAFVWIAFTEAFFMSVAVLLLAGLAMRSFKIRHELWNYVFITVFLGIIYAISSGLATTFFAVMFESILALAMAYGLMQTRVFKKWKI